jgi:hypothetical protein
MAKATNEERLMKIETQVEDIKETMKNHCEDQREDFDKVLRKLDEMHNAFAGKWVEKVVIGGALALITIIMALINFII